MYIFYFYFVFVFESDLNWNIEVNGSMVFLKISLGNIWINLFKMLFIYDIFEFCYFVILVVEECVFLDVCLFKVE